MNPFVKLWNSVKSNPYFVAGSSAFVGAAVSVIQDEMASGRIDWTRGGINKMTGLAVTAAISAVIHLYRSKPASVPPAIPAPQSKENPSV